MKQGWAKKLEIIYQQKLLNLEELKKCVAKTFHLNLKLKKISS